MSQGEKRANKILAGPKETAGAKITAMVTEGKITLKAGALRLELGSRQVIRIKAAYQAGGEAAIIHGYSGKPSNRRTCGKERERALSACKERYPDFVPAFAAEKLKENGGIMVSGETLRQWLVTAGLRERKRKSRPYERRDRRPRFGDLARFGGSRHGRFEGRGKKRCLMNMADDTAGKTLSLLSGEETAASAMAPLSCLIKKYGIPEALCRGRKNACAANREPAAGERLAGEEPRSPRAKGRAERNRAVCRDCFAKEPGLASIPAAEEAAKFLSKTPVPKTGATFAKPPAGPRNAHVPLEKRDLRGISCFEYRRSASRGCAVSFERRLFQILKDSRPLPRPGDKAAARVHPNSSLDICCRDKKLSVTGDISPLR